MFKISKIFVVCYFLNLLFFIFWFFYAKFKKKILKLNAQTSTCINVIVGPFIKFYFEKYIKNDDK